MKYAMKSMLAVLLALAVSLACGAPITAVNVLTFGAKCDGATNDAAAIQKANDALTGGGTILLPQATCFIGGTTINLGSNVVLQGAGMGASVISSNNGDVSQIKATSKTKVVVRDLTVSVSIAGTTGYVAGVHFATCTYCIAERVEVTGVSWGGVYLDASSYSTVQAIYTHDFRGSVQDSSDVALINDAKYNIVRDNKLYAQNWHGVLVQGIAGNPMKNLVAGNRIGQHAAYGIAVYMNTTANNWTQVVDNYIEDIQGTALAGTSGACIYVVSAGGVLVKGNTVRNCTVQTTTLTLAPAGIGVSGIDATIDRVNVIGNIVEAGATNWDGIYIVSSAGGANVVDNVVTVPAANTGATAGIDVNVSSNVVVSNNHVTLLATTGTTPAGIYINASSPMKSVAISGNVVVGGNGSSIRTFGVSTLTGVSITGNVATAGGTSNVALQIAAVAGGLVTGNYLSSTIAAGGTIQQVSSTNVRYTGNFVLTTGITSASFAGTNTGSYFDKTNFWDPAVGVLSNTGTGMITETLKNSALPGGTCAVGDRVEQSVPVVGNPKGWRCTAAGSPGTWVSEGNL